MPNDTDVITVDDGDTLWKIAKRHDMTMRELLAMNPEIRNPNAIRPGQRVRVAHARVEQTLRFVNLLDQPPVGVRYQILDGEKTVAAGRISDGANEASFTAQAGKHLKLMAQKIGDTVMNFVGTLVVDERYPVQLARINSAKIPSSTAPHPKSQPPAAAPAAPKAPPPAPGGGKNDQGVANKQGKDAKGQPEHVLQPGDCACGKDMTIDQLAAVFPSRKKADLEKFLAPMNTMMKAYGIDSCLRKSHALAQIGHESGSLRYMAEVLPKGTKEADVYDGYKGRGLIQLTYKRNYEAYGKHVGKDFLGANKVKLEEVASAVDSAGWFWNNGAANDLNPYADKNDLLYISSAINGAFNGFDDRVAIFKRAHKALGAPACKTKAHQSAAYLEFKESAVYDMRDVAFAWGHWSDPDSKKEGVKKDAAQSKSGYKRFLELHEKKPIKKKRFGFKKVEDMITLATEKSK